MARHAKASPYQTEVYKDLARHAKEALRGVPLDSSMPRALVDSVDLMEPHDPLDEVVTNVISYGYDDHDEHHINVTLRSGQGVIEVSVVDDGKPFNPLEFRTPDLKCPIDERPVGGLGIYLVKTYMNELEYERTGVNNCLIMRKRF